MKSPYFSICFRYVSPRFKPLGYRPLRGQRSPRQLRAHPERDRAAAAGVAPLDAAGAAVAGRGDGDVGAAGGETTEGEGRWG